MILSRTFNVWNHEITWGTNNILTKDENGKNVPHLEITEVVLMHCNIANNDC